MHWCLPIEQREILRFAQNDNTPGCHSERSEESLVGSHPADPTQIILRAYDEETANIHITPACFAQCSLLRSYPPPLPPGAAGRQFWPLLRVGRASERTGAT